jgi:hypothetical protein
MNRSSAFWRLNISLPHPWVRERSVTRPLPFNFPKDFSNLPFRNLTPYVNCKISSLFTETSKPSSISLLPIMPSSSAPNYEAELADFPNIFSLKGKVIVVTGGSRGLGLHAASGHVNSPLYPKKPSPI